MVVKGARWAPVRGIAEWEMRVLGAPGGRRGPRFGRKCPQAALRRGLGGRWLAAASEAAQAERALGRIPSQRSAGGGAEGNKYSEEQVSSYAQRRSALATGVPHRNE